MERVLQSLLLCVLFVSHATGEETLDQPACNLSPFADKRPHSTFMSSSQTYVSSVCQEEAESSSRPACLPQMVNHVVASESREGQPAQEESPIVQGNNKKIKSMDQPKNRSKKQVGNKKLKGSKRQRKKKKKKKKAVAKKKRKG